MKKANAWLANTLVSKFLEINKTSTMSSIYARINPADDGRIRTVLSPCATETGRFGSSATFLERSTNLQNLPKKTAGLSPLYDVRGVIMPTSGNVLCSGDFSAAERRLLAYLAREKKAIQHLEEGINTYKWFAAKLYKIPDWRSIDKKHPIYLVGKMGVLAFDRGVGWRTFKEAVNKDADLTGTTITAQIAKEAEALFHREFPGYRRYFKATQSFLERHNWTTTNVMGRQRTFYGRRTSDAEIQAVVREAVSFQAQAVGDILNAALARIYTKYDPHLLRLLLQVHDDIIWEASEADWKKSCRAVKRELERPITLPDGTKLVIPAEVSMSKTSWANMDEVKL